MEGIHRLALFLLVCMVLAVTGCTTGQPPAEKKYSDEAFAWNGKGFDAYVAGNYTEALGYFDRSIEIEPEFSKAWSNRGMTLVQLGRYQEAADAFNKTLEIDPEYLNAREMRDSALSKI